jgi:hypothetical protein
MPKAKEKVKYTRAIDSSGPTEAREKERAKVTRTKVSMLPGKKTTTSGRKPRPMPPKEKEREKARARTQASPLTRAVPSSRAGLEKGMSQKRRTCPHQRSFPAHRSHRPHGREVVKVAGTRVPSMQRT